MVLFGIYLNTIYDKALNLKVAQKGIERYKLVPKYFV